VELPLGTLPRYAPSFAAINMGAFLAMLMVTLARLAAYSLTSGHHREEEGHEQPATCPNGGRQKCLVPD
jgi:hypothetical protein